MEKNMKVEIDITKTVEQNAAFYYEKAKKSKKKILGAEQALQQTQKKLLTIKPEIKKKDLKEVIIKKKKWYEKFRWFTSSEGFLCIGGRDATTNDIIVRKQMQKEDLVLHTEIVGSPFFLIKSEGKTIGVKTIEEAAQATASYSRAWKHGITITDVYCVKPEQVKKELGLPKGTFMIHGQRNYFKPVLQLAIGKKDDIIIGGPVTAITHQTKNYLIIDQGDMKTSDMAKSIKAKLGGTLEEIQSFLPPGRGRIKT
ncbi:MAG: NFACT RNA binding domain-containing protein [Nanoarchaeota archaeon]|nr:NFACT RNA binding domain-containing protein [Nanoarchaeota archaeon]